MNIITNQSTSSIIDLTEEEETKNAVASTEIRPIDNQNHKPSQDRLHCHRVNGLKLKIKILEEKLDAQEKEQQNLAKNLAENKPDDSVPCLLEEAMSMDWKITPVCNEQLGLRIYTLKAEQVHSTVSRENAEFEAAAGRFHRLSGYPASIVKRVDVIKYDPILSTVSQQYQARRAELAEANPDAKEVWVYHGTKSENLLPIIEQGFKVGGKDAGVGITNGAVFGNGVYTAMGPATPMAYSRLPAATRQPTIAAPQLPTKQLQQQQQPKQQRLGQPWNGVTSIVSSLFRSTIGMFVPTCKKATAPVNTTSTVAQSTFTATPALPPFNPSQQPPPVVLTPVQFYTPPPVARTTLAVSSSTRSQATKRQRVGVTTRRRTSAATRRRNPKGQSGRNTRTSSNSTAVATAAAITAAATAASSATSSSSSSPSSSLTSQASSASSANASAAAPPTQLVLPTNHAVIVARGLLGCCGQFTCARPLLSRYDSWGPGNDVLVFREGSQLLPCYIVYY